MRDENETPERPPVEAQETPEKGTEDRTGLGSFRSILSSLPELSLKHLLAGIFGLICAVALVALLGSALVSGLSGSQAPDGADESSLPNEAKTREPNPGTSPSKSGTTSKRETARGVTVDRRDLPPPSKSCDDLRVLVDRSDDLPAYYEPKDLASLRSLGLPTYNGDHLLRIEAARHLEDLIRAARRDGVRLFVASAYRSYADQESAYSKWSSYYGDGDAGGLSAKPGQSQHQLGTVVDFTNAESNYEINQLFGQTRASEWLKENAPDYGYALAYPRGMKSETGYGWEPWHYRYIGTENTKLMREGDLSLQELLEAEGVRPRC